MTYANIHYSPKELSDRNEKSENQQQTRGYPGDKRKRKFRCGYFGALTIRKLIRNIDNDVFDGHGALLLLLQMKLMTQSF